MRVGLNLLYIVPGQVGGTQTYAERLIKALAAEPPRHEYQLFLNSEAALLDWPATPNFRTVVCEFSPRSRAARYAYEQLTLPRRLREERSDIVHSMGYVSPLRAPCPTVVTIHDAIHVGYPLSPVRRAVLGTFVGRSARGCDRIITVSNFSKREIVQHFGISPKKITVTHHGPRELPVANTVSWDLLSRLYSIAPPFIAAFGGVFKHKNLARLVAAFATFASEVPHKLLLIGRLPPDGHVEAEIRRLGLTGRVVLTGYIPGEHIMPLLTRASVFAFPSWYEGFGLPVLDAQLAGIPVACSRAASLPEVAGEAAEYFDPFSIDEMARALRLCTVDAPTRSRLIARGNDNLRRFSWQKAARTTLDVYEGLAQSEKAASVEDLVSA